MSQTPPRRRYVPTFAPVPSRRRAGGWTPMKQAAFLGALAESGSVRAAALRVGMSRESAYRLRGKPGAGSFAAAWDAVLGRGDGDLARKVTPDGLAQRAHGGLLKPLFYRGRHVATVQKADNSALLRLLAQLDRGAGKTAAEADGLRVFTPRSASTSPPAGSPLRHCGIAGAA